MYGFAPFGSAAYGAAQTQAGTAPISTVTGVTVTPSSATVAGGGSVDFDWVITGTNGPSQSATVTTSLGAITSDGVLTAPAATSSAQTGTVTVTSAQDPTKSGASTFTVAAAQVGDTTAPILTAPTASSTGSTTASGSVTTNEAGGTLYWLANTNATATASQVKAGSSKAVTATGAQAVSVTGLTAGATLYLHFLHADGAATPNESVVANTASFTTQSAGDTTGPVMQGELIASKTATTTTITVPVATDASGIGEYFFAIDGGVAVSNGSSRTKTYTGLAPLSAHLYEATATDTLGNPSSNSLSLTVVTDAAGDDPSLVLKNIVVTLKGRDLAVQPNAAGIYWTWSDARGTVTSFGNGLTGSAAGVLTIPIRTRLLSDGVGFLTLDNYNGGNALTYFGFAGPVRVP